MIGIERVIDIIIETVLGIDNQVLAILGSLVVAMIAYFITHQFITKALTYFVSKTATRWDDLLVEKKVFNRLAQIVPISIIYISASLMINTQIQSIILKACLIYLVGVVLLCLLGCITVISQLLQYRMSQYQVAILSSTQVIKLLISLMAIVVALGILLDKSPLLLLSGLGALTAIIILVFKDAILGFVASIQVTANQLIQIDDWIEMPQCHVDGEVVDINLMSIKIQNWDKTISTIPTYSLVSQPFKNWKGMMSSGGRRIKRTIYLDQKSMKMINHLEVERYMKEERVAPYMKPVIEIFQKENKEMITNGMILRQFLEEYLMRNDQINHDMTCMVRYLNPSEKGLPLEVYAFSKEKEWILYEKIQADLIDFILGILNTFEIQVYQIEINT